MATNEGRVYFALDGADFEPKEVSKFLGLEATAIKRKGSRIPGKVPKQSSWQCSTENMIHDYIDVFQLASQVIQILKPKKIDTRSNRAF